MEIASASSQSSPEVAVEAARNPVWTGLKRGAEGLTRWMLHPATNWAALFFLVLALFVLPPAGMGLPLCGLRTSTGIPCPGCGLTRSVTCVYNGKFEAAWQLNPFGFGFAVAFMLLGPLAFLPSRWRALLIEKVRAIDVYVFLILMTFLFLFIVHGLWRAFMVEVDAPSYDWWRRGDTPPALSGQIPASPTAGEQS